MQSAEQITVTVGYVLGHSVACEHCDTDYLFLDVGQATGMAAAEGYSVDAKQLGRQAISALEKDLRRVISNPQGVRPCPECHCFQGFQVESLKKAAIGRAAMGVFAALLVGVAIGFLFKTFLPDLVPSYTHVGGVGVVVGALLGGAYAFHTLSKIPSTAPQPGRGDPCAMTLEAWKELSAEAEEGDPLFLWAARLGVLFEGMAFSLGYAPSGGSKLPTELRPQSAKLMFKELRLTYDERRQTIRQRDKIEAPSKKKTEKKRSKGSDDADESDEGDADEREAARKGAKAKAPKKKGTKKGEGAKIQGLPPLTKKAPKRRKRER